MNARAFCNWNTLSCIIAYSRAMTAESSLLIEMQLSVGPLPGGAGPKAGRSLDFDLSVYVFLELLDDDCCLTISLSNE